LEIIFHNLQKINSNLTFKIVGKKIISKTIFLFFKILEFFSYN